jgi:hypothetical protein
MLPSTSVESFDKWRNARTEEIIREVHSYSEDDAQPIIDLIPNISPQVYFER